MNEVDDYILQFSDEVQASLHKIRRIILRLAPEVEEQMSYGMPGYKTYKKPLVYFAAFKHHIGLYATPSGHAKFEKELSSYKQGKGSVQFPLDQPIPFDLIESIVAFRVKENEFLKKTKK